jgi:hypothetical protein
MAWNSTTLQRLCIGCVLLTLPAVGVLATSSAAAEPLDSLLAVIDTTEARHHALQEERRGVRVRIAQLAREVDSLKQASSRSSATGRLRAALADALVWVDRDESLGRDLNLQEGRLRHLRAAARLVVKQDLSSMADGLSTELPPGSEALRRLDRLRAIARGLHGHTIENVELSVQERVAIYSKDGPDEIRQKADLVWDMADHVEREAEEGRRRLRELELEKRLRRSLSRFAGDVALFDEDHSTARAISTRRKAPDQGEGLLTSPGGEGTLDRTEQAVAPSGPEAGAAGSEILRDPGVSPTDLVDRGTLEAEIASARTRVQTLDRREEQLRTQAEAFRRILKEMLETAP